MVNCPLSLRANSPSHSDSGAGKQRKEGLQLRLWNLNSSSISPVAPRRRGCQITAEQLEAETSANVNKHRKSSAKGNDVINNVISANQHFASTFAMQIFKFQRRSCKFSFFPPSPAARAPRRACSQASRFSILIRHFRNGRKVERVNVRKDFWDCY